MRNTKIKQAYKDWDLLRNSAIGTNDRSEIDAIFTREIYKMEEAHEDSAAR